MDGSTWLVGFPTTELSLPGERVVDSENEPFLINHKTSPVSKKELLKSFMLLEGDVIFVFRFGSVGMRTE